MGFGFLGFWSFFRFWVLGFWVFGVFSVLGFGVLGFRVQGLRFVFQVLGSGRVQGLRWA